MPTGNIAQKFKLPPTFPRCQLVGGCHIGQTLWVLRLFKKISGFLTTLWRRVARVVSAVAAGYRMHHPWLSCLFFWLLYKGRFNSFQAVLWRSGVRTAEEDQPLESMVTPWPAWNALRQPWCLFLPVQSGHLLSSIRPCLPVLPCLPVCLLQPLTLQQRQASMAVAQRAVRVPSGPQERREADRDRDRDRAGDLNQRQKSSCVYLFN